MLLGRIRATSRTLRFRLAAWNAAVVILTALVTLFGLRQGVHYTLVHELDQLLLEDIREIGFSIGELHYPTADDDLEKDLERKARGHAQHGWFVQLLDPDGKELWASFSAPPARPLMPQVPDGTPVSVDSVRLVQRRVSRDKSSPIIVRVGATLSMLQQDMSHIDRLAANAAIAALLIAPACGYWLAGRATRPLADIINTTDRLRPEQLNERLPLRGTGDELDHLSRTFNGLLDRIAIYLQQKRDFLANAAHELRTPLAAIRSSVEVALNSDRTRDEYEELLANIIEEGASLELLVNQLLLLAETEADRLKTRGQPVRMDEVIQKAVAMFHGAAEVRDLELYCEPLPAVTVEGNRDHFRQVLNNLLDNAIKFTPPQGRITVSLAAEAESREAVLRVADTGIGIPEADMAHLFDRFYRADKSRRRDIEQRGTGLGLSICQAVATAHGGRIHVESELGRGTTFVVRLPLAPDSSS